MTEPSEALEDISLPLVPILAFAVVAFVAAFMAKVKNEYAMTRAYVRQAEALEHIEAEARWRNEWDYARIKR
jgi:hypothetical protein